MTVKKSDIMEFVSALNKMIADQTEMIEAYRKRSPLLYAMNCEARIVYKMHLKRFRDMFIAKFDPDDKIFKGKYKPKPEPTSKCTFSFDDAEISKKAFEEMKKDPMEFAKNIIVDDITGDESLKSKENQQKVKMFYAKCKKIVKKHGGKIIEIKGDWKE